MSTMQLAVAAAVLGMAVAACGPAVGSGAAPETSRGPVPLEEAELVTDAQLSVAVPSCNGDPEVAALDEDDGTVYLEVVTTQVVDGPAEACLDLLEVALDAPLGERDLVDLVSGERLRVTDTGGEQPLECLDADYPIEPTFDTAEAALEHALAEDVDDDAGIAPAPTSVDDYEAVERADGSMEFRYDDDGDRSFVWGVIQDEDGRWGVVSLGGCFPADG